MRQNKRSVFHKAIITSICCVILVGCGYKTNPVYVDENNQSKEAQIQKEQKK
ncbi:hypothetical protein MNB_SV-13-151 [hydrothermal vent metagenome]|uniref:Lipoprotein n=1 Tax=hydrothermal vent metagenome TaxID=652676 RepID=A0A1W1C074_9ZZZZ